MIMSSTMTTITALGAGATLGVATVISLVAMLSTRESTTSTANRLSVRIARYASIGVVPLIVTCMLLVIITITELL
ncbi:hypothetical protein ACFLUG_05175 [Chloroflexota bacterium]